MIAPVPQLSTHARRRWRERCVGLQLENEWETARRPGKVLRRKIREGCPGHFHLLRDRVYRGFWYAVSQHRVVFVVAGHEPAVVVTVWRLPQPEPQA